MSSPLTRACPRKSKPVLAVSKGRAILWAAAACAVAMCEAVADPALLEIPKWLPAAPGQQLQYRVIGQQGREAISTMRVVEVTHSRVAYSATLHVSFREQGQKDAGREDADFDVDIVYKDETLSVSVGGVEFVCENVSPSGRPDDKCAVKCAQFNIAGEAQIATVGTKVAVGNTKWEDATVVTGNVSHGDGTAWKFKATLSPPECLLRGVFFREGDLKQLVIELAPPRRPFDPD